MNVQVVNNQVDYIGAGIAADDGLRHGGQLPCGWLGVGRVKRFPACGSTAQNTFAVPHLLYSLSGRLGLPGAMGLGGLTSACRETGFS